MGEAGWIVRARTSLRDRDWKALGVTDFDVAFANLQAFRARRSAAFRNGYYVEAIALTAHELEFFLSLWYAAKTQQPIKGRVTLGTWVDRVYREGFDPQVVEWLRQFNQVRRQAIHRMLLGEATYDDLRDPCREFDPLVGLVAANVVKDFMSVPGFPETPRRRDVFGGGRE